MAQLRPRRDRRLVVALGAVVSELSFRKSPEPKPEPLPLPSPPLPHSMAEEIERLAALHASGALSEEEFTSAKARLLGR